MESTKYPYQNAWENWRFRVRILYIMLITGLLLIGLLFIFEKLSTAKWYGHLFLAYFLLLIVSIVRITTWKCPRCRRRFFPLLEKIVVDLDYNCQNCGMQKYEGSNLKDRRL